MLEIIIIHNMNNTEFVFVFVHNRILPGRALILADMRTKLKPPVSVSFSWKLQIFLQIYKNKYRIALIFSGNSLLC